MSSQPNFTVMELIILPYFKGNYLTSGNTDSSLPLPRGGLTPASLTTSHFTQGTPTRPHHCTKMYWCVLLLSLAAAGAQQQEDNAVVDFSDDTFAESVPVKPHFVMFYAPW